MNDNQRCGFFNSNSEGDRPYDAEDISQMMTGMVTGGVFPNVGDKFNTTINGTNILIGTGKAWWHGKWFENSSSFLIEDGVSSEYDRIDILVIEFNENIEVRDAYFKIIKGIPGETPEEPEITNSGGVYQLPIARILRSAGDASISELTNLVGTIHSPFAETALDPHKALYLYQKEEEEVDVDYDKLIKNLPKTGTFTFKNSGIQPTTIPMPHDPLEQYAYVFTKTITFNEPFGKIPNIVVTPVAFGKCTFQAYASNVYRDKFNLNVLCNSGTIPLQDDIPLNWIAIVDDYFADQETGLSPN